MFRLQILQAWQLSLQPHSVHKLSCTHVLVLLLVLPLLFCRILYVYSVWMSPVCLLLLVWGPKQSLRCIIFPPCFLRQMSSSTSQDKDAHLADNIHWCCCLHSLGKVMAVASKARVCERLCGWCKSVLDAWWQMKPPVLLISWLSSLKQVSHCVCCCTLLCKVPDVWSSNVKLPLKMVSLIVAFLPGCTIFVCCFCSECVPCSTRVYPGLLRATCT